jgi:SMODS and SLOG-associating 2TM effector domain
MPTDRTPLLQDHARNFWIFNDQNEDDFHTQFCKLIGIPPTDLGPADERPPVPPKSLYGRALQVKKSQQRTYSFTAAISNSLLLSQVVLGAAVTGLGASESSHILITIFGALNTIIAGVVAYLKSRGQPMRARMFRDDLERVVDEIENSEIMWRGEFYKI